VEISDFLCVQLRLDTQKIEGVKLGCRGGIRIGQPLPGHLSLIVSFKIWRAWWWNEVEHHPM